jgi:hypothetical protein
MCAKKGTTHISISRSTILDTNCEELARIAWSNAGKRTQLLANIKTLLKSGLEQEALDGMRAYFGVAKPVRRVGPNNEDQEAIA